jgi:predicted dinucleotide-binding enzyme
MQCFVLHQPFNPRIPSCLSVRSEGPCSETVNRRFALKYVVEACNHIKSESFLHDATRYNFAAIELAVDACSNLKSACQ